MGIPSFSMQILKKKSEKKNPFLLAFVNKSLMLVLQTLRVKIITY